MQDSDNQDTTKPYETMDTTSSGFSPRALEGALAATQNIEYVTLGTPITGDDYTSQQSVDQDAMSVLTSSTCESGLESGCDSRARPRRKKTKKKRKSIRLGTEGSQKPQSQNDSLEIKAVDRDTMSVLTIGTVETCKSTSERKREPRKKPSNVTQKTEPDDLTTQSSPKEFDVESQTYFKQVEKRSVDIDTKKSSCEDLEELDDSLQTPPKSEKAPVKCRILLPACCFLVILAIIGGAVWFLLFSEDSPIKTSLNEAAISDIRLPSDDDVVPFNVGSPSDAGAGMSEDESSNQDTGDVSPSNPDSNPGYEDVYSVENYDENNDENNDENYDENYDQDMTVVWEAPTTQPFDGSPTAAPTASPTLPPGSTAVPTKMLTPSPTTTYQLFQHTIAQFYEARNDDSFPSSQIQIDALNWLYTNDRDKQIDSAELLLERYVMALLYLSMDGDDWTTNENWLSDTHICFWDRITCNSMDQVEDIDIFENNADGDFPTEIGFLTALTHLALHTVRLQAPIPSEIGYLTKLTSLDMDENRFTGTVPTQFGLLTNLKRLDMTSNRLSGTIPSEIGLLTRLTALEMGKNGFYGTIPSELGQLTGLVVIYLDNNELTGTIPQELLDLDIMFADWRNNLII